MSRIFFDFFWLIWDGALDSSSLGSGFMGFDFMHSGFVSSLMGFAFVRGFGDLDAAEALGGMGFEGDPAGGGSEGAPFLISPELSELDCFAGALEDPAAGLFGFGFFFFADIRLSSSLYSESI